MEIGEIIGILFLFLYGIFSLHLGFKSLKQKNGHTILFFIIGSAFCLIAIITLGIYGVELNLIP